MLGRAGCFDDIDMVQVANHHPIRFGIGVHDDQPGPSHRGIFGVADFMDFAVGEPDFKRLEWLTTQHLLNRFVTHAIKYTTVDHG